VCRHLAYLGPPCSPAEFVLDAPHSLLKQSYAPADMRHGGTVNADGFGLGWYAGTGEAVRYRRPTPIWTDQGLGELARSVRTRAFVAAIRSATIGMPVLETACAPFQDGSWLFSHNGLVRGWPHSMTGLAEELPTAELLCIQAPTDSALLWLLLRDRLRRGADPVEAVLTLLERTELAAPGSRLNFLLTDGDTLVATAWTHALSIRASAGVVLISSEPTDAGPGWRSVPDGHAVVARRRSEVDVDVETIALDEGRRR
jgi:glutamine amidotransferase